MSNCSVHMQQIGQSLDTLLSATQFRHGRVNLSVKTGNKQMCNNFECLVFPLISLCCITTDDSRELPSNTKCLTYGVVHNHEQKTTTRTERKTNRDPREFHEYQPIHDHHQQSVQYSIITPLYLFISSRWILSCVGFSPKNEKTANEPAHTHLKIFIQRVQESQIFQQKKKTKSVHTHALFRLPQGRSFERSTCDQDVKGKNIIIRERARLSSSFLYLR